MRVWATRITSEKIPQDFVGPLNAPAQEALPPPTRNSIDTAPFTYALFAPLFLSRLFFLVEEDGFWGSNVFVHVG
jgi:hypothetical protein